MKQKEITFAMAQALIFIAVLALVWLPSEIPPPASPPPPQCATARAVQPSSLAPSSNVTRLPNGNLVLDAFFPAFFIAPDSSGVFCVTYFDNLGKTAVTLVAGKNYLAGTYGSGGILPLSGDQLNVTASPSAITVQPGLNETVAYNVTSGGSLGLYQVLYPPSDCYGMPVFVGSAASQVNETAYLQLKGAELSVCTSLSGDLSAQLDGVVNLQLLYVGMPNLGP